MTDQTTDGAFRALSARLDRPSASGELSMNMFAAFAARLFGVALVALSVFVSVETVSRKLFNFSFEGADELGGYVLAVGSSLAFVVALVDRAHIRIDVLHARLPKRLQSIMDWLSILSIAGLGIFILYVGRIVIEDTIAYGSTAPTPWATPLIWPQAAWYGALCLFSLSAIFMAIRATMHVVRGQLDRVSEEFHPKGAAEELEEEMSDLERR